MIESLELTDIETNSKRVARAELVIDLLGFIKDVDDIALVETDTIELFKLNSKAMAYTDVIEHIKKLND